MSVVGVYFLTGSSIIFFTMDDMVMQHMYVKLPLAIINNPQSELNRIMNNELHINIMVLSYILCAWLPPLYLTFDLFWIYFKLKKQPDTLTQQQVEAFD